MRPGQGHSDHTGLSAQLTDALTPASDYCANIADVGGSAGVSEFLDSDLTSMIVAMFNDTNHGDTKTRSIKQFRSGASCLRGLS